MILTKIGRREVLENATTNFGHHRRATRRELPVDTEPRVFHWRAVARRPSCLSVRRIQGGAQKRAYRQVETLVVAGKIAYQACLMTALDDTKQHLRHGVKYQPDCPCA